MEQTSGIFDGIAVILLAAGNSTRMGKPKGLLDYRGKPFIVEQLERLYKHGLNDTIVVLGKDFQTYLDILPKNINYIAINLYPDRGQFSSIQCGLEVAKNIKTKAAFVLPIDVPTPAKEVWERLVEDSKQGNYSAIVPAFNGKRGHPVLLDSTIFDKLLAIDPNTSRLDSEIKALEVEGRVKIVEVNDGQVTLNLNTKKDWEKFLVGEK